MKIDQTGLTPLQQVEEKEAKSTAAKGSAFAQRQGVDLVEISSALEQQNTLQLEQQQAQRIASIRAEVQAGSYRVDSRLVAQKMLSGDSRI